MSGPKVRLYVKSEKTVTGTEETEREVFMRQLYTHPDRVRLRVRYQGGRFVYGCLRQKPSQGTSLFFPRINRRLLKWLSESLPNMDWKLKLLTLRKKVFFAEKSRKNLKR